MYELIIENEQGDRLTFNDLDSMYVITDIQGLNPPKATIYTASSALIDGGKYTSARAEMRDIKLAFSIEHSAEYARMQMYKVLRIKQPVTIYYKSEYLDVWTIGYIQTISPSYGAKKQIVTVDILCPSPYLKGAQEIVNELSSTLKKFHFPFASTSIPELVMGELQSLSIIDIENLGGIETGIIFELYARNAVTNPIIYNYVTQEYIQIKYSMQSADLITINTEKGHKTATLLRSGVESNLFNYVAEGSTWLQLELGNNEFTYDVGTGNKADLSVTIRHFDLYEGV